MSRVRTALMARMQVVTGPVLPALLPQDITVQVDLLQLQACLVPWDFRAPVALRTRWNANEASTEGHQEVLTAVIVPSGPTRT